MTRDSGEKPPGSGSDRSDGGRPSGRWNAARSNGGRDGSRKRDDSVTSFLAARFGRGGRLAGAILGAAGSVAARRLERSARRGLIDWPAVERVAVARVRNGRGALPTEELRRVDRVYAAAMEEIVPALGRALGAPLPGVVERSAVISREEWIHDNVATFAAMIGRVERDVIEKSMPEGMGLLRAGRALASRVMTTRQMGLMLGFLGQRILGQYDIALLSAEAAPGRLVFLDENIRVVAAGLGVPLNPFRTWIALHETTHAFEFEAHPWLRPYLAGRLERQLASLTAVMSGDRRQSMVRFRQALRNAGSSDSLVQALLPKNQQREFRELQAIMSVVEGFGDHVMDEVGRELVPDVELISARFHARRAQRTGFERAMMKITGMELKMEQYRKGEEFVAAAVAGGGREALSVLWRGPETLPLPWEIDRPSLWLARVMPQASGDARNGGR
jgi:coenzyme F420 biosynthesis associated uncharacterized protein